MKQNQNVTSHPVGTVSDNAPIISEVRFLSGTINEVAKDNYSVLAEGLPFEAKRAFDCLAKPEIGDLVLLTVTPQDCFISQILSRTSNLPLQLAIAEDLCITSDGAIKINGQNGVQIQTSDQLELNSEKLAINNLSTRFRTLSLFFQAKEAESNVGRLKLIADWVEQKAETIRQRFTRSDRVVKEADQQQAGSLVQRVDKTASLRAEHTIIKARKDVQVDGKRIHMG